VGLGETLLTYLALGLIVLIMFGLTYLILLAFLIIPILIANTFGVHALLILFVLCPIALTTIGFLFSLTQKLRSGNDE